MGIRLVEAALACFIRRKTSRYSPGDVLVILSFAIEDEVDAAQVRAMFAQVCTWVGVLAVQHIDGVGAQVDLSGLQMLLRAVLGTMLC